jgi:hypothetical protein
VTLGQVVVDAFGTGVEAVIEQTLAKGDDLLLIEIDDPSW